MSRAANHASAQAAVSSCDMGGRILHDFRLIRLLGQGGMGQVYLAEQISLKRPVAVKIMRADFAITAEAYERFKAEAEAIARLNHPHIVHVYAFGEESGLHYMALEYVEGRNLAQYLMKKGTIDVPLAISIVRQTSAALQRASELGIIHRDIKPENLLLTRRGEVKVADFGLSRCFGNDRRAPNLTHSGMTVGTPLYMSPEQVQGLPVDPRTDIYSLGVTCYQMLAGQPPFRGNTAFELAMQHVGQSPISLGSIRPDLAPQLCAMVHKMMAKEPDKRYSSCGELLKDLAQVREGLAGGRRVSRLEFALRSLRSLASLLPSSLSRKRQSILSWLGVTIMLALACGGSLAWKTSRPRQATSTQPAEDATSGFSEAQKHERFLKEAIGQYSDPADNQALAFRRDLGLFYLREDRLEDASRFFNDLAGDSTKSYQTLGRLGQAIVLAGQDRAEESNRIILQLMKERKATVGPNDWFAVLFNQPQLRYEIACALNRNKHNLPKAQRWPAELEKLREAPKRSETSADLLRQSGLEKIFNKRPKALRQASAALGIL